MLYLFLKALLATIVIEASVACRFKERSVYLFLLVILANVFTNPTLNLIVWYLPDSIVDTPLVYGTIIGLLEVCVVFAEAALFQMGKITLSFRRAFNISFILNLVSFSSGVVLTYLGFWE